MHKIPHDDLPISVVFLVAIGMLVGASILRAAIGLCITITGGSKSPGATQEASIVSALLITL